MVRAAALGLTVLTGFSGLVYEVVWQKYLATLLGSQSEATAAVLGIFLGGLSLGYWLFGVATRRVVARAEVLGRPPRLFLLYGAVELGIGVWVISFPWLFRGVQALSTLVPSGATGPGFAVDVLLAALLIGPASVLMGGTIPILTQSLARSLDDATRFHALVYAFNTAGAFVGALAAGFYLVPAFGLENLMLGMGAINLFAGGVFALLGVRGRAVVALSPQQLREQPAENAAESLRAYMLVASLTGFALMAIQTIVIRVGVLSFGSSQFTFSMVVAVFVLSIALGSFIVSSLSAIPRLFVVLNQWGVAFLLLLLYLRLDEAPYWVYLVRSLFRETNAGFLGYYFIGFLLVLVFVGVPVIFSGAVLPLLFHQMRREVGHLGDVAGTLYSWNTVGSLLGALIGGYALFFWLDLHEVYRVALGALLVAAVILGQRVYGLRAASSLVLIPLLILVAMLPAWNPEVLYAGLSRQRGPRPGLYEGAEKFVHPYGGRFAPKMISHRDDPNTSVAVREHMNPGGVRSRSISTDGKDDGDTLKDYATTGLMAVLPAMMADRLERAFVIGRGVGITAGELGSFESIREVHVAEISRAVIDAAPLFDFATLDASTNPKIHVIHSDAYRALVRSSGTWDVIVAAPSQVWVAGVEMLMSREFLEAARDKLSPGGVYLLFLNRYESDAETIALVMRTFAHVFEHVSVWQDVNDTLLLLGFDKPEHATDHYRLEAQAARPDFQATLVRTGIRSFPALLAHEVIPLGVLRAAALPGPLHSLYHPRLNDLAARAFFRGDHGALPFTGFGETARIGARNSLLGSYAARFGGRLPDAQRAEVILELCRTVGRLCNTFLARWQSERSDAAELARTRRRVDETPIALASGRLEELAALFDGSVRRAIDPLRAERASADFVEFYHHAAPFRATALEEIWSACREGRPSEASCRSEAERRIEANRAETASVDDLVRECLSRVGIGQRCQRGLMSARELVEHGRIGATGRSPGLAAARGLPD